jgi:hypothetical protein
MSLSDYRFCLARDHIPKIDSEFPELHEKLQSELKKIVETLTASSTGVSKYQQQERLILNNRLQSFEMKKSKSFFFFQEQGWTTRPFSNLVSIAELFSHKTGILMDRESKRRKTLLFKWLEDNWEACLPYAQRLDLEYEQTSN